MHGQFCWYDLFTTDPAAAKRYYTSLFGWKTVPFPAADPGNPYDMWSANGTMIGGVGALGKEQLAMNIPPHWMVSVEVNNVDETARKATSLGGKVVMGPMEVPETGRYAIISDPQGATIAIFKPAGGPMDSVYDGTPTVGKPSWHELMTTDYQRAFDFYRQVFGWDIIRDNDMGPLGMYREFGMKGRSYGGMFNRPPEMAGMHPFWLPYVYVKDVNASTAAAQKLGATIVNGPMAVPGGDWIVVMGDPQNAAFAMHAKATTVKTAVKKTVKKTVRKAVKTAKKTARKAKKAVKKVKAKVKKSKPKARPKAKAKKKRR